MEPTTDNSIQRNQTEFSVKDAVLNLQALSRYLKTKRKITLIFCIAGIVLGISYSIFKKPVYTAKVTFTIQGGDESGGLSGIASAFGLDVGGDKSTLFEGDNLMLFFQSRAMVQKTLLSEGVFDGKKEQLVERYIDYNKWRQKWTKPELTNIKFTGDENSFTRLQDSVLGSFYKDILKRSLEVGTVSKKTTVIELTFKGKDELFAQEFTEKLTANVADFYTKTKTQKSQHNIDILQYQTDSVRKVLNSSIANVAQNSDNAPNANPLKLILKVPSQKEEVNVEASEAELAELLKNLELTKITFRKETPLIEYIDFPILPLDNDKVSKVTGGIFGLLIGWFLSVVLLSTRRMFKRMMA